MNELIELDFTLVPTFTIYEASRDLMRARRAEWHDDYTLPSLWNFFTPNREAHGSYWFYWTTEDEVEWKENFRLWMMFVNEYKNRGGRVAAGSDSGFIYKLYGFGFIRFRSFRRRRSRERKPSVARTRSVRWKSASSPISSSSTRIH